VLLRALEVRIARLQDVLEDRATSIDVAHQEQRLRDEPLVVHRQRGGRAGFVVGHGPRDAGAVRAIEVAEGVRGVEPIATKEGGDLAAIRDRAGAEPMGCRDRHRYRCPGGQ
jgi:hypothetical protein